MRSKIHALSSFTKTLLTPANTGCPIATVAESPSTSQAIIDFSSVRQISPTALGRVTWMHPVTGTDDAQGGAAGSVPLGAMGEARAIWRDPMYDWAEECPSMEP